MMNKKNLLMLTAALGMTVLTSCKDDNKDGPTPV
jgi:hypothetical protein